MSECKIGECKREVTSHGMCPTHHSYAYKKGLTGILRFPSEPLRRCLRRARLEAGDTAWAAFSERVGVPLGMIDSVLKHSKITWTTADEIAIALGLHPILIYPNWTEVFDMDAYLERRREAGLLAEALVS